MKTKIKIRLLPLLLLLCLVGCTTGPESVETASDAVIQAEENLNKTNDSESIQTDSQSEDEAEANPIQEFSEEDFLQKNIQPVIKVDILGYKNHDIKTAFFTKGKVGDIFYVVNADSGERVYQGTIESKRKGDFSAVTKDGNYFIEAAHIGRSHVFSIQKDRYQNTFHELQEKVLAYVNKNNEPFEDKIVIWNRLVQYGDDLTADPEQLKAAEEMADKLVSESDTYKSNTTAYIEELAVYSASMAMFYRTVNAYDEEKAASYLAEAEDTYILVESEKAMLLDEAYLFYPAAALYCATGKAPYESATEKYLKEHTERDFFADGASEQTLTADEMYLFGALAYLNTTYKVNVELCEGLMQNLSMKAEKFADQSKYETYFCVANDFRNRFLADRLYTIAVVENAIVSKEYTNILKNGIHYLGGCNETGGSYFSDYGIYDAVRDEKSSEAFLGSAYLDVLDRIK